MNMEEFKPFTIERPWGSFRQFTHNESVTVKIIFVKKGESLSLQYHKNRKEFWCIISGYPIVIVGENIKSASPGDEFTIEKLQPHQIKAEDNDVQFLEIASGDFNEEDIIRIKDKYGRA